MYSCTLVTDILERSAEKNTWNRKEEEAEFNTARGVRKRVSEFSKK
jgi:hypothetical protein